MKKQQLVSVVVPVFNEEELVARCLVALLDELEEKDEIIVVDNNSADKTASIVKKYAEEDPRVHYVKEERQGTMFARKTGFDMAQGNLLCTIDADTRVLSGWRLGMVQALESAEVDAISSYGIFDSSSLRKFNSFLANHILYGTLPIFLGTSGFLFGSNLMMKKKVWEKITDEVRLNRNIWDDYEITLLAHRHGMKIGVVRTKLFVFSARRSLDSVSELFAYAQHGRETLSYYSKVRASIIMVQVLIVIGLAIVFVKPGNFVAKQFKSD